MKTYIGQRAPHKDIVYVKTEKGIKKLPWRLEVTKHSPTGFSWGYGGSGPAQLALAILLDHTDDDLERVSENYETFKWKVIAKLPEKRWELSEEEVKGALTAIERNHELPPIRALEQ